MSEWLSDVPTKCDLCGRPIVGTFVDGKTRQGPWGLLCWLCWRGQGFALGTGTGQRYVQQPDGRWLKKGD